MLELVKDNRSGERLEIVIMTYNESKRISNFIDYYADEFDIVLLDDSSTDLTVQIATESNATIFKRLGNTIGENHFVDYSNRYSMSGYCFYIMADEFCNKNDLLLAFKHLRDNKNGIVIARKYDWFYSKRSNYICSASPRGFNSGMAKYNNTKLHNSLGHVSTIPPCFHYIDLQHFHVWSMSDYFGSAGKYAMIEIQQFQKINLIKMFVKRFIVSELLLLPLRIWRNRKLDYITLLWLCLMAPTILFIALLCIMELVFLPSSNKQLEFYKSFYQ